MSRDPGEKDVEHTERATELQRRGLPPNYADIMNSPVLQLQRSIAAQQALLKSLPTVPNFVAQMSPFAEIQRDVQNLLGYVQAFSPALRVSSPASIFQRSSNGWPRPACCTWWPKNSPTSTCIPETPNHLPIRCPVALQTGAPRTTGWEQSLGKRNRSSRRSMRRLRDWLRRRNMAFTRNPSVRPWFEECRYS